MLKTIRSLGPAQGPGWLQSQAWRPPGLLQDSWERARLGCVRGQVLVWPGDLSRRNFSKRKRENRGTQRLFREFSTAAVASCASTPLPQPLDCERQMSSPSAAEAWLAHTQISGLGTHNLNCRWARALISGPAAWGPDPKCPSGRLHESVAWGPHLNPRGGARPDKQPGCLGAQTKSA